MKKPGFTSPFLRRIVTRKDKVKPGVFPFDRLSFLAGGEFELDIPAAVTFLVGENGSGKSTLLEAVARAAGFPGRGGSRDHAGPEVAATDALADSLRLSWLPKINRGFFFRSESFFGLADYLDDVGDIDRHGGQVLGKLSHGESFLAVFQHRLNAAEPALYLLDEPEVALSPSRQLAFLRILWQWQQSRRIQAIIATHSPILMSLPGAALLSLDAGAIRPVVWQDTEHYKVTRSFLAEPKRAWDELFRDDDREHDE